MYAEGGSDWKNDVSKTATCGMSGAILWHTLMHFSAGGLWSGANVQRLSIFMMTSGVMSTEESK